MLEVERNRRNPRNVAILALDGLPHSLAARVWQHAAIEKMHSVVPSTSVTAWLSALSGMKVEEHGVPGVIFKIPQVGEDLVNAMMYNGPLDCQSSENIFSDAITHGYFPLSIRGDFESLSSSWRRVLLGNSHQVPGLAFYSDPNFSGTVQDADRIALLLEAQMRQCADEYGRDQPCLIWCIVDMDLHVHKRGYDEHVLRLLSKLEGVALRLVQHGFVVVAHSDHGLVPTHTDAEITRAIDNALAHLGCSMGGAGRIRWLYTAPGQYKEASSYLRRVLPLSVAIRDADDLFVPGSVARERVGDTLVIAGGREFIGEVGYIFDHGSASKEEMEVPLAIWSN